MTPDAEKLNAPMSRWIDADTLARALVLPHPEDRMLRWLYDLTTPDIARRQGGATRLLVRITTAADELGITIGLGPAAIDAATEAMLRAMYATHGFRNGTPGEFGLVPMYRDPVK